MIGNNGASWKRSRSLMRCSTRRFFQPSAECLDFTFVLTRLRSTCRPVVGRHLPHWSRSTVPPAFEEHRGSAAASMPTNLLHLQVRNLAP